MLVFNDNDMSYNVNVFLKPCVLLYQEDVFTSLVGSLLFNIVEKTVDWVQLIAQSLKGPVIANGGVWSELKSIIPTSRKVS